MLLQLDVIVGVEVRAGSAVRKVYGDENVGVVRVGVIER